MFERFTPRARRVIVKAQDAAREMGHSRIHPEHLVVGLDEGEGMAAIAMAQAGVDGVALRQRAAARYAGKAAAKKVDRVPFSPDAKQCLEQSLRAALSLGHSYIGTEHLFFGVERQADDLDDLLGVAAADVHRRITDLLAGGGAGPAMRSPALHAALDRARADAGQSPMTTGQVLAGLGVDPVRLGAALDAVDVADTSDAAPAPQSVAVTIGDATTVITDPDVATALRRLSADQLRDVLKDAAQR